MYAYLILGIVATSVVWRVVYNVFFSPLRHIPGPFIAKVTSSWLMFVDLAGNRTTTIHRLHQRYGPSVRIAPTEVCYSNSEMLKEIYGQQTAFMKAPVYDTMSLKPLGIFSMRVKSEHSQRRRLLSHAFSQSNLFSIEPTIKVIIQKLLSRVEGGLGTPLDMLSLFRLTAFDIVGELFLGQGFGGLSAPEPPQFLLDMDYHFILSGIEAGLPWLYQILVWVPIPAIQHLMNSRERLIQYGEESFAKYINQYGRESGRKDLLTKIVSSKSSDDAPLTDIETSTEISNLVFAGTDTTSTTLTYLFWELAKNPEWQTRLRAELSETSWEGELPSFTEIVDLPILDALITEALRLHPAAPASLPRETPPGGRVLNGVFVPEKTVVSVQCYTTQRDPFVFQNPNAFLPERWMASESALADMKTLFAPFSQGSRACLGKSLAMMELKMVTASLAKNYVVGLAPNTTDETMGMTDHFLVIPKGGKCDLIFTRA